MTDSNRQDNYENEFTKFFKRINDYNDDQYNDQDDSRYSYSELLTLRNHIKYLEFEIIKVSACIDSPNPEKLLIQTKILDIKKQCDALFNLIEN